MLSVVKWLAKPYSYDLGLNGDSLASRVVYELEHASCLRTPTSGS